MKYLSVETNAHCLVLQSTKTFCNSLNYFYGKSYDIVQGRIKISDKQNLSNDKGDYI